MARKSRSRSQSEPVYPSPGLNQVEANRKDAELNAADTKVEAGWPGSLRNFVWGIWNRTKGSINIYQIDL